MISAARCPRSWNCRIFRSTTVWPRSISGAVGSSPSFTRSCRPEAWPWPAASRSCWCRSPRSRGEPDHLVLYSLLREIVLIHCCLVLRQKADGAHCTVRLTLSRVVPFDHSLHTVIIAVVSFRIFWEPMKTVTLLCVAVLLAIGGCGTAVPDVPVTIAQYDQMRKDSSGAYLDHVILMHNLLRPPTGRARPARRGPPPGRSRRRAGPGRPVRLRRNPFRPHFAAAAAVRRRRHHPGQGRPHLGRAHDPLLPRLKPAIRSGQDPRLALAASRPGRPGRDRQGLGAAGGRR